MFKSRVLWNRVPPFADSVHIGGAQSLSRLFSTCHTQVHYVGHGIMHNGKTLSSQRL